MNSLGIIAGGYEQICQDGELVLREVLLVLLPVILST